MYFLFYDFENIKRTFIIYYLLQNIFLADNVTHKNCNVLPLFFFSFFEKSLKGYYFTQKEILL